MRLPIALGLIASFLLCVSAPAGERADTVAIAILDGHISADELAELLGVYVWKFDASVPAGAKQVIVTLQSASKGQLPSQLGSSASGPINHEMGHQIMVAIVPIAGSIFDASQVRVTVSAFGTFASSTADNPLKSMGISRPQRPENAGDGAFNLLGGYAGSSISSPISLADELISLKIETK